jgi:hypothetical protein
VTAWAVLRAACSARERTVLAWLYAVFALLACIVAVSLPRRDSFLPLTFMILPTFFAWAGWFGRLVLLQRSWRATLMPGGAAGIASALGLASSATILLPALASAAWGAPFLLVLSGFVAMAAAGVLFVLLPRGLLPIAGLLPMALNAAGVPRLIVHGGATVLVPAITALLLLACAWRWRAVLLGGSGRAGDWSQPFMLAIGERGSFWRASGWRDPQAQLAARPRWMQPGRDLGDAGPARPVRAMRTWLGSPFAPLSARQWCLQAIGWVLVAAVAWGWIANARHPGDARALILVMMVFVGAGMVIAAPALRLQAFKRAAGAELAELALLPGWHGAAATRRVLLAAIAGPTGLSLAGTLVVVIGVATWLHEDAQRFAIVLVALAAIAVGGAAACLRALAGLSFGAPGRWLAILGACLLFVLTTSAFEHQVPRRWLLATGALWCALAVGSALALRSAWVRWQAQPHPFLAAEAARP